jgi:hypothetical protein
MSEVLRGKRIDDRRAFDWARHVKIHRCIVIDHPRIDDTHIDKHGHARASQRPNLQIASRIRACTHRSRASTFARRILHLDIHEQRVSQLDNPHNQQQQHR